MSKLKHFDNLGTARFVTISCFRRYRLLADDNIKRIFIEELAEAKKEYAFELYSYVIMPNHVHLVFLPPDPIKVGELIGKIKAKSSRNILAFWRDNKLPILDKLQVIRNGKAKYAFWTARCFDHNCRTAQTTLEKINYCHMNPVKAGLVKNPGDWKWSSYRWYMGDRNAPLEITVLEA